MFPIIDESPACAQTPPLTKFT